MQEGEKFVHWYSLVLIQACVEEKSFALLICKYYMVSLFCLIDCHGSFPQKRKYTFKHPLSYFDASTLEAFNQVAEAGPLSDLPARLATVDSFLPTLETDLRTVLYKDGFCELVWLLGGW
jgi:hypothetical protein